MRHVAATPCLALALALSPSIGQAEPLPRPQVDYVAEGTINAGAGNGPGTMRHASGKMRIDTVAQGLNTAIYFDIQARTATIVTQHMGQKIAMRMDPADASEAVNVLERDAKRLGELTVAGERCDIYEFEVAKGRTLRACVTRDGIGLRTHDPDRDHVIWEATRLSRTAQNPTLFVVPSDAVPMAIPRLK